MLPTTIICSTEKAKSSLKVKVAQSCSTLCDLIDYTMDFSRPEYWSGYPLPSPGDLPNPGIESRFPALRADSLSAEPQGKPKNTGVDSLSFSSGSSPSRNQTRVSCIAGGFFINWAIRKALYVLILSGGRKKSILYFSIIKY